jgi:hypothetical protein
MHHHRMVVLMPHQAMVSRENSSQIKRILARAKNKVFLRKKDGISILKL